MRLIAILSAIFVAIIAAGIAFVLSPGQHRHPPGLVVASAILMACSGWLYASRRYRVAGVIQAVLMLGVGAYLISLALPILLSSRGWTDNAAAGAIAMANVIVAALGALTIVGGLAVILSVALGHRNLESHD